MKSGMTATVKDGENVRRLRNSTAKWFAVIFELQKSETNIKPDITDDITSAKLEEAPDRQPRQDLIG